MAQASSSSSPRRRISAEDRRASILVAAERAFAAGPFHQVSLEDVAREAEVSKALIYEHFDSKRDLYQALLSSAADELMRRVKQGVLEGATREQRLLAGIEAFVGFVAARPGASRLLFHDVADPDVARGLDRLRDEAANVIALLMAGDVPAARQHDPIPTEVAVSMLAHQLIGALQSLANWWHDNPQASAEQVTRIAMEFAWLGLERLADGERWQGVE